MQCHSPSVSIPYYPLNFDMKTRNLDADGSCDVRRMRGTPPDTPTARLNVRLRRYTAVLIAHDHIEFGTNMMCIIATALSLNVRQGRSALPSM
jgi:hypothetical protein